MQTTFAYTIVNFNTLLIVNNKTQEQRYANNVTVQDLYSVTQAQQDISVVAYSAAAYLQAMRSSITAQANVNVVYNVTPNLSYSVAV